MSNEAPTGVKAVWAQVNGSPIFVEWSHFDPTPAGLDGFFVNARNTTNTIVETLPHFGESGIGPSDRFVSNIFTFGLQITKVEVYANYGGAGGATSAQVSPNAHASPVENLVVVSNTITSINVSWSAPAVYTGTIAGYRVLYRANGVGGWTDLGNIGTGTSYNITGLAIGTSYQIMVRAITSTGESSFSDIYQTSITASTVNITVPDAPGAPTATRGATSGSADLVWTAPAFNGGAPIDYYVIQYSDNGTTWTTSGTSVSLSATVIGLSNGTNYVFRVIAHNSVGNGAASGASNGATPGTAPGAPTGVAGTVDDRKSSVSWTAPADNGYAITSYEVRYSDDNGLTWDPTVTTASSSPVVIDPLARGVNYVFQVRALNGVGWGPWSASSGTVVPTGLPDAPVWGTPGAVWDSADINNALIRLYISEPAVTGGFPIDNYRLQAAYSTDGGLTFGAWQNPLYPFTPADTQPWFQVSEPLSTPTQWVKYRVAAITYNGTGPYAESNAVEIRGVPTPGSVPTAVQNLAASPKNQSIVVTWDPPASAGTGGTINTLTYIVEYSTDGGATWTIAP